MEKFSHPYLWIYLITGIVWLLRARQAKWTLDYVPNLTPSDQTTKSSVSVILPAKNEEKNIRACLDSLLKQDHSHLQILVANDQSTDKTEELIQSMGFTSYTDAGPGHKRAYLSLTNPTPEGWTGKNFAIHSLIPYAQGDWLLFTDADTWHDPASIRSAVTFAESRDLSFLSLTPHCHAETFVEEFLQPSAMGFLGLWFPLEKTNQPSTSEVFANGQYLLIKRDVYSALGGHEKVRGEFLEDFALMRAAKHRDHRALCVMAPALYGTRMYHSLPTLWRGWRRIYKEAFRSRAGVLLGRALSVFLFSVIPFALFPTLTQAALSQPEVYGFAWGLAIPTLLLIWIIAAKTYDLVRARPALAIFHPAAAIVITLILLNASWVSLMKQKTKWR